ncbi:MAG: hypothetical protein NTX66_02790 [Candidatus Falkowbacteria bacterium]|nr:hypothetical protein [Candidatus Falkowbacteria bacterium]
MNTESAETDVLVDTAKVVKMASYETLEIRERTVVSLPKTVDFTPGHTYGKPAIIVKEHYRRGVPIGKDLKDRTIFVNIFYYGFTEEHLGTKVSAQVTIQAKKKDGRKFVIVNVTRNAAQEKMKALHVLKIGVDTDLIDVDTDGPVLIPDTDKFICFAPIR